MRDGFEGDLGVGGRNGQVQYQVHVGVGQQLVDRQRADALLLGDGCRSSRVQVGDGDQLHRVEPRKGIEILGRNGAAPDHADPQRLAHSMPLSMMVRTLLSCNTSRL